MKYLLVGLGNIGQKKKAILKDRCMATVDPYNKNADYREFHECPPSRYDAVILSVPNDVKIELLKTFLGLGKHVLVDKPLLIPSRQVAEELEGMAQKNKAIWHTSYNHRFEPLIVSLKEELDKKTIGKIYHGRLFYGNGTVSNAMGSWREKGSGVLEDLGSHLLDFLSFLLGLRGTAVVPVALLQNEAKTFDHCKLATEDGRYLLEMSFTCWKNTCEIVLHGENGSLILKGLCKWGPSELVIHKRVRPSGKPHEERKVLEGPDVTWERDINYFEMMTQKGQTSMENDWWISETLAKITHDN